MSDIAAILMPVAMIDIGVRELQRDTSRLVREVAATGTTYRITIQGRPTGAVLGREGQRTVGATMEEVRAFWQGNSKPSEVVAAQHDWLEQGRDAVGLIGAGSPYDQVSLEQLPD